MTGCLFICSQSMFILFALQSAFPIFRCTIFHTGSFDLAALKDFLSFFYLLQFLNEGVAQSVYFIVMSCILNVFGTFRHILDESVWHDMRPTVRLIPRSAMQATFAAQSS